MHMYEKLFNECLGEYLENKMKEGQNKFIILPMGDWGRKGRELLRKKGIEPICCFDNHNYNMKDIYPLDYLDDFLGDDIEILVLTIYEEIKETLLQQIKMNRKDNVCFVAKEEIELSMLRNFKKENGLKLDFLCVGFPKCGTSSLYNFLKNNTYIELPSIKETMFISNVSMKGHDALHRYYTKNMKGTIIKGGIEPTYRRYSKYVAEYFGKDIKLVFCLRNPVEALYSLFKMHVRFCGTKTVMQLYEKYNIPSIEMFKEYVYTERDAFNYAENILEWLQYYAREQMIFLISEEMFLNPNDLMKELQIFIGLSEEQILECELFPHSNEGAAVTKDYFCAKINNYVSSTFNSLLYLDVEERNQISNLRYKINELTKIEFNEKIPQDLYDELLEYYMPSIKCLEEIMGRSLEGVWY